MFGDLTALSSAMMDQGVTRLYAKTLAPNDNSKNQVYLGGSLEILNLIPFGDPVLLETEKGRMLKAPLRFYWLRPEGGLAEAPGAQLILYPQYPEVRFSGFLRGCLEAPSELMASRDVGRILFLGVREDRTVVGFVVGGESALAREFERIITEPAGGIFRKIELRRRGSRSRLLASLRTIFEKGWIKSRRLDSSGVSLPCRAPNCGGFTLEAELGIRPNSRSEPDFEGWEVKQHAVIRPENLNSGVLTLMTPEPTAGIYRVAGIERFIRKYGYADRRGRADRINIGGTYRFGKRIANTGLTLTMTGYDTEAMRLTDPAGGIWLVADDGKEAAGWPFAGLLSHWNRKHAQAAYVPSQVRSAAEPEYRFGPFVRLGEGTDFLRFLRAIASGLVYYDPGIKMEAASTLRPRIKRRSQFRIRSGNLGDLYARFETVDLRKSPST